MEQVYCGQGGALIRRLAQGIWGVHVGRPAVFHHIQYCGRCSDPPLGDDSGREDTGQDRFGRAVQNLAALLYTDDGILYPPLLTRIQEAL